MWWTTCGLYIASTGGIQSSKLKGKYSYRESVESGGLVTDVRAVRFPGGETVGRLIELELVDSSSDRERPIGGLLAG